MDEFETAGFKTVGGPAHDERDVNIPIFYLLLISQSLYTGVSVAINIREYELY